MPIVMEETDELMDAEAAALDAVVSDAAIAAEMERFAQPLGDVGDLSRGGKAGAVNVHPNSSWDEKGKMIGTGRPTVRRAWMWNGTETTLTLGWNPEGTQHDGARPYLAKKHCHCCGESGFRLSAKVRGCPRCTKSNCGKCRGGADRSRVIPCFYLKRADVPYPIQTVGPVDCLIPSCLRRDGNGFATEADMRLHAGLKHRREYAAHMEATASAKASVTEELQRRVDVLTQALLMKNPSEAPAVAETPRKPPVVGTPERPLYVSDKPKRQQPATGSIR